MMEVFAVAAMAAAPQVASVPAQPGSGASDVIAQSKAEPVKTGDTELQNHPQFKELPFDEDYSGLRTEPRASLWARLKYIPLTESIFVTLGGEARTRFESRGGQRFGRGAQDDADLEFRFRTWADLHVGEHLRGFVELKSGLQQGYDIPQTVSDRKDIDIGQAFVEARTGLGSTGRIALRVGRQEIGIGAFRLFDMRDGLNVRRSLDAARLLVQAGSWNGEILGGYAQRETLTAFDNHTDHDFGFYGARLARTMRIGSMASTIEGLWIRSDRQVAAYNAGTAAERRNTFSLRVNGRGSRVDYDVEGTLQNGRWANQAVSANYLSANASYLLSGAWAPKIGVRFERGSGDRDAADARMNTYFSLFARPLTLNGELNRSNVTLFGPSVTVTPTKRLTLDATVNDILRTSRGDGIYLGSGVLLRGANEGRSRQVGVRGTLGARYLVSPFVTVGAYANHVEAGRYLRESGDGSNINYATLFATFRF